MPFSHTHYLPNNQFSTLPKIVAEWRAAHPDMGLLVFLPAQEQDRVSEIQAVCREHQVPLIGALFPALLDETHFFTSGAWLICLNPMPPHCLLADLSADSTANAAQIAQAIAPAIASKPDEQLTLFMIFDGLLPNVASTLNDLWRKLHNAVKYAGVNAGSETFQPTPCLFDEQRLIQNGVLCFLLPADVNIQAEHGYKGSSSLMKATATVGNRIDKLDGRPALTVLQEIVKAEYGSTLTPENFYEYAVHFPFGLTSAVDVLVRIAVDYDEDGALHCISEVPINSMLRLLVAPSMASSTCVATMAATLKRPNNHGKSLTTFYCAGRRLHFGDAAQQELHQLQMLSGASALVGALTLGEIDTIAGRLGMPRLHNATIVCLS